MKNSKACRNKEKVDQVHASDTEDTDSDESVGRVEEHNMEVGRQTGPGAGKCRVVTMEIQVVDKGKHMEKVEFKPLVDSGVHKTLLSEADWRVMKNKSLRIKKCRVKFTPYQTNQGLQMMGRSKAILRAAGGATVSTIVYVVKGSKQSLLGLKDGESLSIIKISPEGKTDQVVVRQLATCKKEQVPKTGVVSGRGRPRTISPTTWTRWSGSSPSCSRAWAELRLTHTHLHGPQHQTSSTEAEKGSIAFYSQT